MAHRRRRLLWLVLAAGIATLLLFAVPWSRMTRHGPATIVLVTVDTLRRDRVSTYAPEGATVRVVTPNFDAIAGAGVVFEDARTPVPLTLPGHAVMLTGLPPAVLGIRVNAHGRLPAPEGRDYALLTERLRDAGWRTGAFVSAEPLVAAYGLDQGFDVYDDEGLEAADGGGLAFRERPGEETVGRALAYLDGLEATDRVFLWVHLFEPHAPYAPDAPATVPPEARYDLDVLKADAIVGRLVAGLEARGRGDAALLLTADHGEALGELGERTHGLLLGDAVCRVPFLLRAPGLAPGRRSDPVDLADVAPTLAGLAGLAPLPPRPASVADTTSCRARRPRRGSVSPRPSIPTSATAGPNSWPPWPREAARWSTRARIACSGWPRPPGASLRRSPTHRGGKGGWPPLATRCGTTARRSVRIASWPAASREDTATPAAPRRSCLPPRTPGCRIPTR